MQPPFKLMIFIEVCYAALLMIDASNSSHVCMSILSDMLT
jgi:hypothetical protein